MSGSRYVVTHQASIGTPQTVFCNITGSATIRLKLYDLVIGCAATPADAAIEWNVTRTTSVGTGGTTLTEIKLDEFAPTPGGAAVGTSFTGDPTVSDVFLIASVNTRATFRWVAAPGSELITTTAANNGIASVAESSAGGTPICEVTHFWEE
jgi:hypothetical protein